MTDDLSRQTQAYLEVSGPIVGDCWRTAIACLLEIPRDEVPHIIQNRLAQEGVERWWEGNLIQPNLEWWWDTVKFVEFAKPGLTIVTVPPIFPVYARPEIAAFSRVIVTGKSPRGDWQHCVIADANTGAMLWDPHPSRAGIVEPFEVAALTDFENGYHGGA